jgi:hypothetical protein
VEKILEYTDLKTELQRVGNAKAKVTPIITGVNRTISKSHRKYLNNIPGKHEIKELQNSALFGTAHILGK